MSDDNRTNDGVSPAAPEPERDRSMFSADGPSEKGAVSPKNGPVPVTRSPLDEQLVAYLDGELDIDGSRRVEAMLASDADVRRRLQGMQRTWDLLDDLDAVAVDGGFTQTTLEMVAVAAGEDLEQQKAEAPRRRRRRLLAIAGSLVAAVAAGFVTVMLLMPDPNRQLLKDLPLLENLDDYRQIDDIKFLRLLCDKTTFGADKPDTSAQAVAIQEEDLSQRRQRVESMSDGEKERFARLEDRWAAVSDSERQRITELHDAIMHSPDAGQLLHVMHHYCEWLQTMPSYRWSEFAGSQPEARLSAVQKRLEQDRARNDTRRLSKEEIDTLWRSWEKMVAKREAKVIERLPPERRERIAQLSPEERHREIRNVWRQRQPGGFGLRQAISEEDLAELRQQLSPETRDWLAQKKEPDQRGIIAGWISQAMRQRFRRGPRNVSDEMLATFFEHDLSPEDQDRLLILPGDEMQQELLRQYWLRTRPAEGPPRRGDAMPGNGPADRRGPPKRPPKRDADLPERAGK